VRLKSYSLINDTLNEQENRLGGTMERKTDGKKTSRDTAVSKTKIRFNIVDLEILFMNAIVICALLLAIVATDLFMS
jgi:hypothetical protein